MSLTMWTRPRRRRRSSMRRARTLAPVSCRAGNTSTARPIPAAQTGREPSSGCSPTARISRSCTCSRRRRLRVARQSRSTTMARFRRPALPTVATACSTERRRSAAQTVWACSTQSRPRGRSARCITSPPKTTAASPWGRCCSEAISEAIKNVSTERPARAVQPRAALPRLSAPCTHLSPPPVVRFPTAPVSLSSTTSKARLAAAAVVAWFSSAPPSSSVRRTTAAVVATERSSG